MGGRKLNRGKICFGRYSTPALSRFKRIGSDGSTRDGISSWAESRMMNFLGWGEGHGLLDCVARAGFTKFEISWDIVFSIFFHFKMEYIGKNRMNLLF